MVSLSCVPGLPPDTNPPRMLCFCSLSVFLFFSGQKDLWINRNVFTKNVHMQVGKVGSANVPSSQKNMD